MKSSNHWVSTNQTALHGVLVATKQGLLGQVHGNLLSHGGIGEDHELQRKRKAKKLQVRSRMAYLCNEMVGLSLSFITAIGWRAVFIKGEPETERLNAQGAIADTALAELLGEVLKNEYISDLINSCERIDSREGP